MNNLKVMNKKGQVTIFIIIAIILVASVILYFTLRTVASQEKLPAEIEVVYNSFLTCIEQNTLTGISVLESQGGYIELPEFEPGSNYMPFSSQLDFLGTPIPYWYYVSGNNIEKEQVPTKENMELQLAEFVEDKIDDCDLSSFYEQGYLVSYGNAEAKAKVREESVKINLDMDLLIESQESTYTIENHDISVDSYLGKLYNQAKKIYVKEQRTLFLEEFSVDILRLYAPVDGVELTCVPKTWSADEVFNDLQQGIQDNILTLKSKRGDYELKDEKDEYFVIELGMDLGVEARFINSKEWPNTFEVNPSQGNMLVVEPVGLQQGLGILGFCYVAYHFVYDVKYPVLVQVYEENEIFQFPLAVVLQGNLPRESSIGEASSSAQSFGLCENKNTNIQVETYDSESNPIEAFISYSCFGETCDFGKSPVSTNFPQCINGYILARAEGYAEARQLFSTTSPGNAYIIMEKLYPLEVDLKVDNVPYGGGAIIYLNSEGNSKVIAYPDQKIVDLIPGEYEIQVYIYQDSSLELEATTLEQCTEVPRSGVAGILGLKEEKCFDIEMPDQVISNVLVGGGNANYSISESEIINSEFIEINAQGLPLPESIDKVYENYLAFEDSELEISFR